MKHYLAHNGIVPDAIIAELDYVRTLIDAFPERGELVAAGLLAPSGGDHWSCHVMSRIVSEMTKRQLPGPEGPSLRE